jgi:Threonine dehydratase
MSFSLTLQDIKDARARIETYIVHTPIIKSYKLSERFGCEIYIKPEIFQPIGAFKVRGALSKALSVSSEERSHGLITTSSGNHAQGVAYAGKMLGVRAVIVMQPDGPVQKRENTEALGGEIMFAEGDYEIRWKKVLEIAAENGFVPIHAYDDPAVMAGQGTIGLEILEDLSDVDTVIVPIGGGGLISGVSTAVKGLDTSVRVVGAEPDATAVFQKSRASGRPTSIPVTHTIADGLQLSVPKENAFSVIEKNVDELITVRDETMKEAVRMIARDAKILAEPSSAICLGTLIENKLKVSPGEKVCMVITGGNWGLDKMAEIFAEK